MYLSAGVAGSFTSLLYKAIKRSTISSWGASAAVLGALSFAITKNPDAKLAFVFLPQYPFSGEQGLAGLILFDLVGLIAGWRIFDHAAHLGGVLFGM